MIRPAPKRPRQSLDTGGFPGAYFSTHQPRRFRIYARFCSRIAARAQASEQ